MSVRLLEPGWPLSYSLQHEVELPRGLALRLTPCISPCRGTRGKGESTALGSLGPSPGPSQPHTTRTKVPAEPGRCSSRELCSRRSALRGRFEGKPPGCCSQQQCVVAEASALHSVCFSWLLGPGGAGWGRSRPWHPCLLGEVLAAAGQLPGRADTPSLTRACSRLPVLLVAVNLAPQFLLVTSHLLFFPEAPRELLVVSGNRMLSGVWT